MLEKQNSVAFDVEFSDVAVSSPPEHIAEKMNKYQERLRRSFSKEEIDGKLSEAAEKKKQIEEERAARASQEVSHAKRVAGLSRQVSIEQLNTQLSKIEDKLNAAADNKAEQERQRLNRLEEHLELVEARKSGAQDAKPELLEADIIQQLNAAEVRRKSIETSKVEKVVEHLRRIEKIKENALYDQSQALASLQSKLELAELRRKELENGALQKLAKLHEHVEQVQRRKSQIAPAAC